MLCAARESIPRGKLIILEGNIGVGKTTLAQELAKQLSYSVVFEPTAKNPYLSLFYEDPKKYALKLQLWIYRQRFLTYVSAVQHILQTGQGVILDRSVFSDKVFAVVNRNDGSISEEGYRWYAEMRAQSLRAMPVPQVTIFLDAAPETCRARILARKRDCEAGIPLAYLTSLGAEYHNFLADMTAADSAVLRFNWNQYGSADAVCEAVLGAPASEWPESAVEAFNAMASSGAAVRAALTLPWTIAEAVLDQTEESDNAVEAEMLARERSAARLSAQASTEVVG